MRFYSIFVFASFFFLFSACSNKPKVSEDKKGEKSDSIANIETVKADKSLVAEWSLTKINNVKPEISLSIVFSEKGDFSMVQNTGTVNGTYKNAEDGKKIVLKSSNNKEDTWDVVELTDSILEISDKDKNLWKFKKN
jgi:hypothetical protein